MSNGVPAFPTIRDLRSNADFDTEYGMSLRDYFAAKALQGMLACAQQPQSGPFEYALDAYKVADAMMKARELRDPMTNS